MFKQFCEDFPVGAHEPPRPPVAQPKHGGEPSRRGLSPRGERIMLVIVGFNAVALFFAPIAGGTVFDWFAR